LREDLEEQIGTEWIRDRTYGALEAGVGVHLQYPLVTAEVGGHVITPVVEDFELPIKGQLALSSEPAPKRVVLLIDVSASANKTTIFSEADGALEQAPALDAMRYALERSEPLWNRDDLELALIAFGEQVWPLVKPGGTARDLRGALEWLSQEIPEGIGRTDLACALWLAYDWLSQAPETAEREILLLTDGGWPFSGRFIDCSTAAQRGRDAEQECELRRNWTPCPASHAFHPWEGYSDLAQVSLFLARAHGRIRVHPLVFTHERPTRGYAELAALTEGKARRVRTAEAIAETVTGVIRRRMEAVIAQNRSTGEVTKNLLKGEDLSFDGMLHLLPGANEIELRVESTSGRVGLFRFRIYAEPRHPEHFLSKLKRQNQELEDKLKQIVHEGGALNWIEGDRTLEIELESDHGLTGITAKDTRQSESANEPVVR
jgi:hypothetical protein